jgi:cytochrome P450
MDLDLFAPGFLLEPSAAYESIRTAGRVVWNSRHNVWMVPGYDDCMTVLRDQGEFFAEPNSDPKVVFWFDAPNMITVDGVEHTRLRAGLTPLFTRSSVARWEKRVQAVVDGLLRPLVERPEGFDLIADLSWIPTIIVAEMLGIPRQNHADFRRWSHTIVANLSYGNEDPERRALMHKAAGEVNAFMRSEIQRHRAERPDDLITAMLEFTGRERLTDAEIVSTAIALLIAGFDSTSKVMANCLVLLERHPDQRRMVVSDPSLVPAVVEEVMRLWGLVQMNPRYVVRDAELAGTRLSAGDVVYLLLGAANHDPARWDDPDQFDITREPKTNLGFGYGPHLCIGVHLARLEVKVAVERLLAIAPEYTLSGVEFGRSAMVRGPERGIIAARAAS